MRPQIIIGGFGMAALVLALCSSGFAQGTLDRPPSGQANERAVAGGSERVQIESAVPLSELLPRLDTNWKLVETGKAYWIGYTADMYSIASHGGKAIAPLMEFIRKSKSRHARIGAVLSLHLIGINSRVVGRYTENFQNTEAREALCELLSDDQLRDDTLLLLVRDPWPSDVPHIMSLLARTPDQDCATTVNSLFRYRLPCPDFGGTLAENARQAVVVIVDGKHDTELGTMKIIGEENEGDTAERINRLTSGEGTVSQFRSDWTQRIWKFANIEASRKAFAGHSEEKNVCDIVSQALREGSDWPFFRYCDLSDPFNFQVSGTTVSLIKPVAAKTRWLAWWDKLSDEQKTALSREKPARTN